MPSSMERRFCQVFHISLQLAEAIGAWVLCTDDQWFISITTFEDMTWKDGLLGRLQQLRDVSVLCLQIPILTYQNRKLCWRRKPCTLWCLGDFRQLGGDRAVSRDRWQLGIVRHAQ